VTSIFSIGTPLGNVEGGSFTRDFERWMKGAVEVSLRGSCMSGTWMEGSFTGDPEEYAK
jgi:hypothetical protein